MRQRIILNLLMEAEYASSAWLSAVSGCTPEQLEAEIDALRADGQTIEKVQGGYRLIPPEDAVWPGCIRRELAASWAGCFIEYHSEIDSTNFRARAMGDEGAPHGSLVVADLQTAGRGRMNRVWQTKSGDAILMSLLIRPESLPAMEATGIVLVAAVAAARACCDEGAGASIKWPNDLVANGKKLCGMLLDMKLKGEMVDYAIVGVGINVKSFPYADDLQHATCLNDACGHSAARARVIARFLEHFEELYDQWRAEGIDVLLAVYRAHSITLGRRVRVIGLSEQFEAEAVDVLPDGALQVRMDDGRLRSVHAGDVSVRGVMDYV